MQEITSSEFKDRILGEDVEERCCVVEVFKTDCEACHYNGTMFDVVSQKMDKHGYLDQLPLYRMNLDNVSPYLGRFFYAPQYVFLRTKRGQITELKTLRIPGE